MRVLDLFCGHGGFSQAFKDRGHEVITVDIEKRFNPDHCIDIMEFEPVGYFDIILASPPCTEFTRAFLPWYPDSCPSTALVERTFEIINKAIPEFWIIENVKGAVPYLTPILGTPVRHIGPRYLWGSFRFLMRPRFGTNKKYRPRIGRREDLQFLTTFQRVYVVPANYFNFRLKLKLYHCRAKNRPAPKASFSAARLFFSGPYFN